MADTDLDLPRAQCTNTQPPSVSAWSYLIKAYLWTKQPFRPSWSRARLAGLQGSALGTLYLQFRSSSLVQWLRWLCVWLCFFQRALFCFCCCACPPTADFQWFLQRENSNELSFRCFLPNVHTSGTVGRSINSAIAFHQLHNVQDTWFGLLRTLLVFLQFLFQLNINFFLQGTFIRQAIPNSASPLIIAMCLF